MNVVNAIVKTGGDGVERFHYRVAIRGCLASVLSCLASVLASLTFIICHSFMDRLHELVQSPFEMFVVIHERLRPLSVCFEVLLERFDGC